MRTFIWSVVLIASLAAVGGSMLIAEKRGQAGDLLRVAFPSVRPALGYEPTDIHVSFEYILLENIYSPLVEFDVNGTIIPGVAEQATWNGDKLVLKIRDSLKTASGRPITADDVVFRSNAF